MNITDDPSPNFGERKDGKKPKYLVLHYTGTETVEKALFNLKGGVPSHQVSAHYVVDEKGTIIRLVDEKMRAWHAGKSYWEGEEDLNSTSIGIEIQNPGHEYGYVPFSETQIKAVIELCRDIMTRHGIPPSNVLAHSDIAPDRKEDPGELFPWERLAQQGIGLWPNAENSPPSAMTEVETREKLLSLGYDPKVSTPVLITAFQRHYVPEAFLKDKDSNVIKTTTSTRLQALAAKKQGLPSCKITSGNRTKLL